MKYIKKLNIDFTNWDEINDKFQPGDKIKAVSEQIYLLNDITCSNIKSNLSNINNLINKFINDNSWDMERINKIFYYEINNQINTTTNLYDKKRLTVKCVCNNFIKIKGYWPWFYDGNFE